MGHGTESSSPGGSSALEMQARYRALFEHNTEAVLLTCDEGPIFAANWAACAALGMSEAEICRAGRSGICDTTDPRLTMGIEQRARTGRFDGELTLVRKDGSRFEADVRSVIVPGAEGYVIVMFRDITERKRAQQALVESEQRFRSLVEHCPIAVFSIDLEGRFISANPEALRISGYGAEDLGRVTFMELSAPESLEEAAEAVGQALQGNTQWVDVTMVRKDGQRIELRAMSIPMIVDGKVVGVWGLAEDVTRRKQAQAELESARAAAEAANHAKDLFLGVLSHELRSPLSTVMLLASALERHQDLPAHVREEVQSIRHLAELQRRIVDDLLDVTRIGRGLLHYDMRAADLHAVIRSAVKMSSHGDGAPIESDLAAQQHLVRGDAARLQQVIWNLLSNARKFTPKEGRITVRTRDGAKSGVRVEVEDTGRGIGAEFLPRIFDPFEHGDAAGPGPRRRGLGLGLAICRAIVEAHNGRITAHSDGEGKGTLFVVELGEATGNSPHQADVISPVCPPMSILTTPR